MVVQATDGIFTKWLVLKAFLTAEDGDEAATEDAAQRIDEISLDEELLYDPVVGSRKRRLAT